MSSLLPWCRYQELNREGLRKIVKKYDKVTGSDELPAFLHHLQEEIFATSTKSVHLKERMETMLSRDKLLKVRGPTLQDSSAAGPLLADCPGSEVTDVILLLSAAAEAHRGRAVRRHLQPCTCSSEEVVMSMMPMHDQLGPALTHTPALPVGRWRLH